jgi:DegV family protein with EDD domain
MTDQLGGQLNMYDIFTDGDCDVTPEIAARYGYHLIMLPYIIDGKEIYPWIDWKEYKSHEFYESLRHGLIPKTCGLNPSQYREHFEPSLKAGHDILYVHFSSQMSGTFSAMKIALDDLMKEYPGRKYYDVDTRAITIGALAQVIEIGEMYKAGKTPEDIMAYAATEVDKWATYFYADNLKFFAKSGRVSGISAFMGGLINIKPIIYMNKEGGMVPVNKALGRLPALTKMLNYIVELEDHIQDHKVYIAHCDCMFLAERMAHMLRNKFGRDLDIEFICVGAVPGSHCGPDCIGVTFHAKHR